MVNGNLPSVTMTRITHPFFTGKAVGGVYGTFPVTDGHKGSQGGGAIIRVLT